MSRSGRTRRPPSSTAMMKSPAVATNGEIRPSHVSADRMRAEMGREQHDCGDGEPVQFGLPDEGGALGARRVRRGEQFMLAEAELRIRVGIGGVRPRPAVLALGDGRDEHPPARRDGVSGDGDADRDFETDLLPQPPADERDQEVRGSVDGVHGSRCGAAAAEQGLADLQRAVEREQQEEQRDDAGGDQRRAEIKNKGSGNRQKAGRIGGSGGREAPGSRSSCKDRPRRPRTLAGSRNCSDHVPTAAGAASAIKPKTMSPAPIVMRVRRLDHRQVREYRVAASCFGMVQLRDGFRHSASTDARERA